MKIKYGIIAVRKSDEDGMIDIVHFCGYEHEPTEFDYEDLRTELSTDESFGLTTVMDELELISAPQDLVEHYAAVRQLTTHQQG